MIVISTHNKHTNKQRLEVVRDWRDALAWADKFGLKAQVPCGTSLMDFVRSTAKHLESAHHDVAVIEHPETSDMWDVAKAVRPKTKPIERPEPLAKSLSQTSDEDERIRDMIVSQMGGSKRHQELSALTGLASKIPSVVIRRPKDDSMPNIIAAIRAQVPEAAGATDQDIADLLTHGFSENPNIKSSISYQPQTKLGRQHYINKGDLRDDKSWNDLLMTYKTEPHDFKSALAKYVVHRIARRDQYADPSQAQQEDLHFMTMGAKDMHPAMLQRIHASLLSNPDIIPEALQNQRDQEQFIKRNFPEAVRTIDGAPHVAVSRALTVPQHGEDYTISSYADVPNNSLFGGNAFRYWVPMNHIWNHYDLHKVGGSNSFGSEDEVLVDKWHPRIPAAESEVRHMVPRGLYSTSDDIPREKLVAHKAMSGQSLDGLPGADVHKTLVETHDYNGHSLNRDAVLRLLDAKNLTGDHLLDLAMIPSPKHMPMFDYEDIRKNSKLTDEHHKHFIAHALQQYNESVARPDVIRDVASVLAHQSHLLTGEQKGQLAADILRGPSDVMKHPYLTDCEKLNTEPAHIALAKLFVKKVPDADTYLRQNGSSVQEVQDRHLPDVAYTAANRISKFLKG